MSNDADIVEMLRAAKTVAVVGLSGKRLRPSYGVAGYLQQHGYRIIPVNPAETEVLGEKAYPSLAEVPAKIDIVDVFRRPDAVPEVVDQAVALGVKYLWLQEDVIHEEAADRARKAGIKVVMDRCILKEHRRLLL
ncbi:MAG: CoA-binding protein [Acidobacteria bacterium]|nr:CoA-binding protein [Acidobacteriota bacterium]